MPSLTLSALDAARVEADVVVVGLAQGPDGPVLAAGAEPVDAALGGRLLEALQAVGATGAAEEVSRLAMLGAITAPALLAVGLGPQPSARLAEDQLQEVLRRAAGAAVRALAGCRRVALALALADRPGGEAAAGSRTGSVAEGALLGAYSYDRFRSAASPGHRPPVQVVVVLVPDDADPAARAAADRAQVVAEAVALARDLVNAPPAALTPAALADQAVDSGRGNGLAVDVLDGAALAEAGHGGILGVGAGSDNPPRLIALRYAPPAATRRIALVGKGITFDSGGLSLKPPQGMELMKSDMGGAAAVLAAVVAVARLGLPVEVTGWLAAAENMPSGAAMRPSDVISMYNGKLVEVVNTDAEGRLVLADAIVRAAEERPDYLVDVATLTGAQVIALGAEVAGVMSPDDGLRERVVRLSAGSGEPMWPMPLPEELRASLDSDIADLKNLGDRNGAMLVGALFLREFVPAGLRWAHLDIAGPSFNRREAYGYTPRGGTGCGVRTLVGLVEDVAAHG